MSAVSGLGTTYNLPNYVGELFNTTPFNHPFLSLAGGISGGEGTPTKVDTWQTTDNNSPSQPEIVEGADPTYEERDRSEVSNVKQIFQYGWKVSYTKEGATAQLGSSATPVLGNQPVKDELSFQRDMKIKRAGRDVNYSMLNGTYQAPANNSTGRKMRGVLTAITTNATAETTGTQLSKAILDDMFLDAWTNGAVFDDPVLFTGGYNKQKISSIYGYAPESRSVGGLNIERVETDFGSFGVVLERDVPTTAVALIDMAHIQPTFLEIPGKGHFFVEPLAQTGAAWNYQLYGEIGVKYGWEGYHAKRTGLASSV